MEVEAIAVIIAVLRLVMVIVDGDAVIVEAEAIKSTEVSITIPRNPKERFHAHIKQHIISKIEQ